jgi:hypothetical protein
MTTPLRIDYSRAIPVAPQEAFDRVLPMPLTDIFTRRYAVLPPIREVREQDGAWGTVGQRRRIVLADGGTMHEQLTEVEVPLAFGYRISEVTGAMRPLIAAVDGRWSFAPVGTGVRVTWAWTLHPASSVSALALPTFGRLWRGYARQALERVEELLLA